MDYNSEYNFFQPFLLPNEVLLWHGAPGPGRINTYGRIPVLFSIIWLGFSLLWEITAIMSGILIMVLFGLPFLLIGLSVAFGGPIKNARLKGKIFYAVTNQRLLIREGTDMKIFTADMLPPMEIRMNKNGTGSIFFESTYYSRQNGNQYQCVCSLQNLTDVGQAQRALSTMLSNQESIHS